MSSDVLPIGGCRLAVVLLGKRPKFAVDDASSLCFPIASFLSSSLLPLALVQVIKSQRIVRQYMECTEARITAILLHMEREEAHSSTSTSADPMSIVGKVDTREWCRW